LALSEGISRRKLIAIIIAILGTVAALVVAGYWMTSGLITSGCLGDDIPTVPITFITHQGSGELVFVAYFPSWPGYTPEQRITNLTYELASYPQGADLRGPGDILRSGPLSGLNTTGSLQFHDVEAEGWFTPNDFFILTNPPPDLVQLRILHGATVIAFNPLITCG